MKHLYLLDSQKEANIYFSIIIIIFYIFERISYMNTVCISFLPPLSLLFLLLRPPYSFPRVLATAYKHITSGGVGRQSPT